MAMTTTEVLRPVFNPTRLMGWRVLLLPFLGVYLAAAAGMLAVLLVPQGEQSLEAGSTMSFMASWSTLYFLTLLCWLLILPSIRKLDYLLLLPPVLFITSSFWSTEPIKSALYGSVVLFNMIFVLVLRKLVPPQKLLPMIIWTLLIQVIASIILYFLGFEIVHYLDPAQRVNLLGGQPMRGLFNHKITAGFYCAIGAVLAFINFRGLLRFMAVGTFLFLVLLSGSAIGFSMFLIGITLTGLIRLAGVTGARPHLLLIISFFAILALGFCAYLWAQDVLAWLGRDPTLTGRTILWRWGIDVALERPISGWGYLGYIGSGYADEIARFIAEFETYAVPHFHDSYIQLAVESGLPFLLLVFVMLGWLTTFWYKQFYLHKDNFSLSMLMISLMVMIAATVMNILYRYNDLSTILIAITIAYIDTIRRTRPITSRAALQQRKGTLASVNLRSPAIATEVRQRFS